MLLTNQFTWFQGSDLVSQVIPWFQYQATEWHAGRFPLWEPYQWYGQPLAGQAQPGVMYPLNWLLFLAPLAHGWIRAAALNWYFFAIHYMAALFAYWLARDLGRSIAAATLAGIAFSFGGYVGNTDWPQMINGAVWAPLIFMFLLRAARHEAPLINAIRAGAALGMSWLSGHHQIPIFLSLAAAGTAIYLMIKSRRFIMAWVLVLLLAVSALVGAAQLWPAYEYGRSAHRWVGADEPVGWKDTVPYQIHSRYSLQPHAVLGLFLPGVESPSVPYLGAVGTVLAFLGIAFFGQRETVRILAVVAGLGFVYALGANLPLEGLVYSLLPMIEKARSPAAAIVLPSFALAQLAAFGFDGVLELPGAPLLVKLRNYLWTAGLGAFTLAAVAITMGWHLPGEAVFLTFFAALFLAALLKALDTGNLGRPIASACLLALVFCELNAGDSLQFTHFSEKDRLLSTRLKEPADIFDFLRNQPGGYRAMADHDQIQYNTGDWWGVPEPNGYLASQTDNVYFFDNFDSRLIRLMGVRYYVGNAPFREMTFQVMEGSSGLKVFEDKNVFPRLFCVSRVASSGAPNALKSFLSNDKIDLRQTAFSAVPIPGLEPDGPADRLSFADYNGSRVVIHARMGARRLVLLTDTFFAGWRAEVDGVGTRLYEIDGLIRGVVVPAGDHLLTMTYRPVSAFGGMALSALGLFFTMLAGRLTILQRWRAASELT